MQTILEKVSQIMEMETGFSKLSPEQQYKALTQKRNQLTRDRRNLKDIATMGTYVHPILAAAQDPKAMQKTERKLAQVQRFLTRLGDPYGGVRRVPQGHPDLEMGP